MCLSLASSLMYSTVSAGNKENDRNVLINATAAQIQTMKMKEAGLTDSEIYRIKEIGDALSKGVSNQVAGDLLEEYNRIVEGTYLASSDSFYSSKGGTLYLEYTGDINPYFQVFYTKVIYFPASEAGNLSSALHVEGLSDYLSDEIASGQVGKITKQFIAEMAADLGVSSTKFNFFLGFSISIALWIVDNLDVHDLDRAFKDSESGAVRLEYFYSTSSSPPYYMNYSNFEPWEDNMIYVPADYDYTWSAGVYDCEYDIE